MDKRRGTPRNQRTQARNPAERHSPVHYIRLILFLIIIAATFLRLWRIAELTEFLGDQGRTGIHIYQAWVNKTLPLVGPTVLTGQHLGPAFYYLMAPSFILGGFNPIWPAVFTAILGVGAVFLLWWLGKELFGWQIATMLSGLWAVSPQIVASDRVLWEPNLVPFFVLLFLVSLYNIRKAGSLRWGMLTGFTLGILVQLHYPNLLFVALTLLFYATNWWQIRQRRKALPGLIKAFVATLVGLLMVLLPFLIYEVSHDFVDIGGVLRSFLAGGGSPARRQIIFNILDYSSRVIRRVIPFPAGWEATALATLVAISLLKTNFWKAFIGLWFGSGIVAISFYQGVVYDHYLFFLLPAPFILTGFFLKWLSQKSSLWLTLILTSTVIVAQLGRSDITRGGFDDLARVSAVTAEIKRQAQGQPFSFALIGSRSFSDLHYRYFLLIQGLKPQPVMGRDYEQLFLVCEESSCPTNQQLSEKRKAQVICYDPYCQGQYPTLDLLGWRLSQVTDVVKARVYLFQL